MAQRFSKKIKKLVSCMFDTRFERAVLGDICSELWQENCASRKDAVESCVAVSAHAFLKEEGIDYDAVYAYQEA